ncbi:hypothetical protein FRC07_009684 [Ceratobasidium sp. 392]|nr:hypothetical protein FRC07_009684 [Ceratobasidium sp. 392]
MSSAHRSSVASVPPTPPPAPPVTRTSAPAPNGLYEIWEPPEEAIADHYNSMPGKTKTPATRLGRVIGAALRAQFTGKPFESPRTSLARSRSVVSESDASTVSRDELLRDAQRLKLPVRIPQPAPPRPVVTQPVASRTTVTRAATSQTTVTRPAVSRPTVPRTTVPRTTVPRTTVPRTTVPRPTVSRPTVPRPALSRSAPPTTTIITPAPPVSSLTPSPVTPPVASVAPPAPTSAPTPVAVPTAPVVAPVTPTSPQATVPPALQRSRTMTTALTTSSTDSWGAPAPTTPTTYKVWRASIGRTNQWSGVSPYTKMIDDAAYKPKPTPPPGTVIESSGEGIMRAEKALYASLSTRPVDERIFWTMPPDHDERVRNRIKGVDAMSRELALYGLDQYLAHGIKGAVMTNAGYHVPEWPESPSYDWITFNDARRTGDKTLQESIAFGMAIWRRKFTVPTSERLRRDLELRKVALEAQKRGQLYQIDLDPPMMVTDELIVVVPAKKKRRKFPWFKVDWGKSS